MGAVQYILQLGYVTSRCIGDIFNCNFFYCSQINLLLTLGMSECTGPQSIAYYGNNYKMYSVGKILPGCENRLAEPDAKGEGEVCMWGRHCMMGYLNRPDKTTEDMDEEGWIHSGDLGTVDKDGFLFITGMYIFLG